MIGILGRKKKKKKEPRIERVGWMRRKSSEARKRRARVDRVKELKEGFRIRTAWSE